jgi:hypothetical protein
MLDEVTRPATWKVVDAVDCFYYSPRMAGVVKPGRQRFSREEMRADIDRLPAPCYNCVEISTQHKGNFKVECHQRVESIYTNSRRAGIFPFRHVKESGFTDPRRQKAL